MNHKRKRPKSTRAGCLLCKPHKRQGVNAVRPSVARKLQVTKAERREEM